MKSGRKQWMIRLCACILCVLCGCMGLSVFAEQPTTGSLTLCETQTGKAYAIYRIFDTELQGTEEAPAAVYHLAEKWNGFFANGQPGLVFLAASGKTVFVGSEKKYLALTEENAPAFAQAALSYALSGSIAPETTVTGTGEDVAVNSLPLGYYLVYPVGAGVYPSGGSICALTVAAPDAEVHSKAGYPGITQEMLFGTGDAVTAQRYGTAGIGEEVSCRVQGTVPDMTGFTAYTYAVHLRLSKGVAYTGNLAGSIGETALTADNFTVTTTDGENDTTDVTIAVGNFESYYALIGQTVEITYTVCLGETANVGNAVNTSTAYLTYSADLADTAATDDSANSTVKLYTTSLTVKKTDAEDGTALADAVFSLTGQSDGTTDKDGLTSFTGIKAGTYTLTEQTPPTGYLPLTEPVTVTVGADFDENGDITWRVNDESGAAVGTDGKITLEIANSKGTVLPATGGSGAKVLLIVGTVLFVGLGSLLLTKKRLQNEGVL